jgi:hypothetical protein
MSTQRYRSTKKKRAFSEDVLLDRLLLTNKKIKQTNINVTSSDMWKFPLLLKESLSQTTVYKVQGPLYPAVCLQTEWLQAIYLQIRYHAWITQKYAPCNKV